MTFRDRFSLFWRDNQPAFWFVVIYLALGAIVLLFGDGGNAYDPY